MRVAMIEACADADAGIIGAWYVAERARRAGHEVDMLRQPKRDYDVELVSVHHCTDYPKLAAYPKRARYRLVGGHPTVSNPRPMIPFADAVCIGEGETWIGAALERLAATDAIESLTDLPGTIVSSRWQPGMDLPPSNVERPLPDNPPYLNRPGTLSAAWYIEIARGCPYGCAFCGLGNCVPFRLYSKDQVKHVLDQADTKKTRKINFYAPDEASHPDFSELYDYLRQKGFAAGFSSMRIESVLRRGIPPIPTNYLIRVGIDGLSERIRRLVKKPILDSQVVEYFTYLIDRGYVQFKTFFIFGYPWETKEDWEAFEHLMRRVMNIPLRKNVSLRIKWTPFIPQPGTPLADERPRYGYEAQQRIMVWHALHARPMTNPGWYVENDGLMTAKTHREQCRLTAGDETVLLHGHEQVTPLHPRAAGVMGKT